jgi:DNA replication and repair protein RecF
LRITQLHLKNFRCFSTTTIALDQNIVLIEGPNGSGKTSFLEALHYICYLRSFRTHTPRDLTSLGETSFFLRVHFEGHEQEGEHDIQVGFSGKKRLVKLNQKPIQSFKELMDYYRVVTLTEDDLSLIKDGPDVRRSFIDQAIVLFDPEFSAVLRSYRTILENRNALLMRGTVSDDSYRLWTEQLWSKSIEIQERRIALLAELEGRINRLFLAFFNDVYTTSSAVAGHGETGAVEVKFQYEFKIKKGRESFADFQVENHGLYEEEMRFRRSLFGAHLDDFSIHFCQKKSKIYSSRGQQKLLVVLLKIAQMQELIARKGSAIFLLDDFMTDFDDATADILISLLSSLGCQLIFTCPARGLLEDKLLALGAQKVKLTYRIMS